VCGGESGPELPVFLNDNEVERRRKNMTTTMKTKKFRCSVLFLNMIYDDGCLVAKKCRIFNLLAAKKYCMTVHDFCSHHHHIIILVQSAAATPRDEVRRTALCRAP
jgi:hypothetical protein